MSPFGNLLLYTNFQFPGIIFEEGTFSSFALVQPSTVYKEGSLENKGDPAKTYVCRIISLPFTVFGCPVAL